MLSCFANPSTFCRNRPHVGHWRRLGWTEPYPLWRCHQALGLESIWIQGARCPSSIPAIQLWTIHYVLGCRLWNVSVGTTSALPDFVACICELTVVFHDVCVLIGPTMTKIEWIPRHSWILQQANRSLSWKTGSQILLTGKMNKHDEHKRNFVFWIAVKRNFCV